MAHMEISHGTHGNEAPVQTSMAPMRMSHGTYYNESWHILE